jgi:hypothetical protein
LTAKRKFSPVTWKQQINSAAPIQIERQIAGGSFWFFPRRIRIENKKNCVDTHWGYPVKSKNRKKEELFFVCKVRDHDRTRSGHDCIENHLGWVPVLSFGHYYSVGTKHFIACLTALPHLTV